MCLLPTRYRSVYTLTYHLSLCTFLIVNLYLIFNLYLIRSHPNTVKSADLSNIFPLHTLILLTNFWFYRLLLSAIYFTDLRPFSRYNRVAYIGRQYFSNYCFTELIFFILPQKGVVQPLLHTSFWPSSLLCPSSCYPSSPLVLLSLCSVSICLYYNCSNQCKSCLFYLFPFYLSVHNSIPVWFYVIVNHHLSILFQTTPAFCFLMSIVTSHLFY